MRVPETRLAPLDGTEQGNMFSVNYFGLLATIILAGSGAGAIPGSSG